MSDKSDSLIDNTELKNLYEKYFAKHKPIKATLAPEMLENIGRIIVAFQRLESTIKSAICFLFGNEARDIQTAYQTHMSFKNLVGMLGYASARIDWSGQNDMVRAIKFIRKAEDVRNAIVHSVWVAQGRIKVKNSHADKRPLFKFEEHKPAELLNIAESISQIDTIISALSSLYIQEQLEKGLTIPGVKVISGE